MAPNGTEVKGYGTLGLLHTRTMTSIPACAVPSGSAETSEMRRVSASKSVRVHGVELVVGCEVGIEEGAVAIDR